MAYHDQILIPEPPEGFGDRTHGQKREDLGKILGRNPNLKTAVMIANGIPLPLQAKITKPIIDSRRGNTQTLGQINLNRIPSHNQSFSRNEPKRLRL